jgi:FlaA1/EpsC-like NDP-sugar epimerase
VDIKVEEIGLRPGEKLYEELLMKSETLDMTENKLIFIEKDAPLTREQVEEKLSALKTALEKSAMTLGSDCVKAVIAKVVPTFRDPHVINQAAADAEEMKSAHHS